MFSILAVDPSFGGCYNVKKALSQVEETVLICTHPDAWRRRPEGTIDITVGPRAPTRPRNEQLASEWVRSSRFVFLIGGSAITVADNLLNVNWRSLNTAAWFTDSFYRERYKYVNQRFEEMQCKRYFALPDGCYMDHVPLGTIPLHHCVRAGDTPMKGEILKIVHSPGTRPKRKQKRSDTIEQVLMGLRAEHNFTYKCVMQVPHAEALEEIRSAHIHIDKLAGYSTGLGKSGLEGMAGSAVELCPAYYKEAYKKYFNPPPLVNLTDAASLHRALRKLFDRDLKDLLYMGSLARVWVEEYWAYETGAWLEYFGRFVDL